MENVLGKIPAFQEERFNQSAEDHMVLVGIPEKRPHLVGSGAWEESSCGVFEVIACNFMPFFT